MNADVWKISISLRKKSGPVVTVAGRGPLGNTLRASGFAPNKTAIRKVVARAFEGFDEFDEFEMERVRGMASGAVDSELGKQAEKGEK